MKITIEDYGANSSVTKHYASATQASQKRETLLDLDGKVDTIRNDVDY